MIVLDSHGVSNVSRGTQVPHQEVCNISSTGLSPSMAVRSRIVRLYYKFFTSRDITVRPYNPIIKRYGLGYLRFRSPLLTESHLIYFPRAT